MNNEDAKQAIQKLAEDIVSVQPMDPNLMKNLCDAAKSEEQLIADGYKPVSNLGVLWVKKE